MLKVGTRAPPFVGQATENRRISLTALSGKPVILYFFHKAFTPNCTAELKGFRDNYSDLQTLGFEVIGISTDSLETHCRFAAKHSVKHPMIGDPDAEIARQYGVLWPLLPFARRVAYVLDSEHTVIAVFRHEFQVSLHLDEILRFVKDWRLKSRAARRLPQDSTAPASPDRR